MPFDVVGAMDRAFQREFLGVWAPESAPGTCIRCDRGEPHMDVACTGSQQPPSPAGGMVAAIDAAVEGRCAGPGCGRLLTDQSASAYWCSPDCQEVWTRRQTGRPSPGSAPVRGSEEVDPSHMRWRPDLVAAFDDSGLTLHWEQEYANGLTSRMYQHADGRLFARLDDGNRWVGMWLSDDDTSTAEQADQMWARLERELGDQRRLDPQPPEPASPWGELLSRMGDALDQAVLRGPAEPTVAERAGGVELGRGARPVATWVDEAAGVDWPAVDRVTASFRRAGEAVAQLGPALSSVGEGVAQAVQAESDRVALRAICTDEAMYVRALAAAEEPGRSVAQMAEAVACGLYTERGWYSGGLVAEPDRETTGVVTAAPQPEPASHPDVLRDLRAACRMLEGHNPAVRFDAGTAVVEGLRSQAPPSRPPASPVGGLFDIPIRIDDRLAPDSWRLEYADGQRFESHVCRWEPGPRQDPSDWRGPLLVPTEWFRCSLLWSDDTRCDQRTVDPGEVRRTERLVSGIPATGGAS